MSQFWTLFVTELKNKRKMQGSNNSFLAVFWHILKLLITVSLVVGILIFVFDILIKVCVANNIEVEFLIFLFLLVTVFELVFVVNAIVKKLKSLSQSKEVLSMPIDGEKVFFVQVAVMYLWQICILCFTLVPILILWGIRTQMTPLYYCMIAPVTLLVPVLPFFLAILISFPLSKISLWLQNKFLLNLLFFVLLVAGGFYLYTNLLKFLLDAFRSQNYGAVLTLDMINQIQIFSSKLYPFVLLKNLLLNTNLLKSGIVLLSGTAIFFTLEMLIAKKFYFKFLQRDGAWQPKVNKRTATVRKQNLFFLLIKKEIINVYRTPNYSFSFFTIALVTPIVVFFCNSLLSELVFLSISEKFYPIIALLITLIFMVLLTSFTATSITREGKSFPLTKYIPVGAKKQIFAKIVFYLMVELPVVLFGTLALYFARHIDLAALFAIFGIVSVVVFGQMCFSTLADAKHPQFHHMTDNVVMQNNSNISKSVFVGLFVALLLGAVLALIAFYVNISVAYLAGAGVAILYALWGLLKLQKCIEKVYEQIEC